MDSESKLRSLICQLYSLTEEWHSDSDSTPRSIWKLMSCIIQIIYLVSSMNSHSKPKPESELMSLITQTIYVFNSIDLDSQPKPLKKLISLISQKYVTIINSISSGVKPDPDLDQEFMDLLDDETSIFEAKPTGVSKLFHINIKLKYLVADTLSLEPEPELVSLIHQIFSLVISTNSKWKKVISVCPQLEVISKEEEIHVNEVVQRRTTNNKWKCIPLNWKKFKLPGVGGYTHFFCEGCNGNNHKGYNKAPLEIKHPLHPKHLLPLVFYGEGHRTRKCYCCDAYLGDIFYCCSACDYAVNFFCAEKAQVFSINHPKWHEHRLSLFPSQASITCSLCALKHSSCPFYICPPCDFVIHQSCFSLPHVIKISRHQHRISFTPSLNQGNWFCGVCRRKVENDYGSYSCIKNGCLYVAHSKCATQNNVWDGVELEGEPEEVEEEEVEPFVTISEGIIQHFSHQHHHLRLDDNTSRDYDEDKLCQACITPIYTGNFYSCMQCDFILHKECAKLSRKIYHPIHPHLLSLVGGYDGVVDYHEGTCDACFWLCKAGFFYECRKEKCRFKLHVQCATISEPLVHPSHTHPLFLTTKPGAKRRICSICKYLGNRSTNETFNWIECDYFALCFKCATLPNKVRYKHDKHMLTLSYGDETSTTTYWCEVCEEKINPKERFYTCDEYCCVTIHIECMFGVELFLQPCISFSYGGDHVDVLSNNHHMSRPVCPSCKKRCQHKITLQWSGSIWCSTSCIDVSQLTWVSNFCEMEF